MNVLAICSALDNTYLGFEIGDKKIHLIIKSDENYHSLYLISKIKQIAKENDFSFNDLDLICVNSGPGSFTGIRVALCVAKIISGEFDIPLVCLNTAEILLKEFDLEYLIMDARRDMYFIGTKDKIELVKKSQLLDLSEELNSEDENDWRNKIKDKKVLTDKNCASEFKNSVCFEDFERKLSIPMIEIAKNKYLNSQNKDEFKYLFAKANYIQTPPVF